MTGKERIYRTLSGRSVDTLPWVPFAGVHAGKLCAYNATEVLQSADKLYESLMKVHEVYLPDGQPVIFDLQLEAEILGCDLMWADDSPPSVISHLLAEDFTIPTQMPTENDGRLPIVLDVMNRMKASVGDSTALYGLITGPLTLATHLRGSELFMDTFNEEDKVQELIAYCTEVAKKMADMYISAGMDVIAVVDPVISQISPEMFVQFLHAPLTDLFAYIKKNSAFSSLFVCGDATKNMDVMCHTQPDMISIDENIDMVAAKKITDAHKIVIGGNIPLTTVMLLGNQQDNVKFIVDFMTKVDHEHLIISPGCDMPYDTPVENTVGIMDALRNPDSYKKMLENYTKEELDINIELPNYENLPKPLIEVFTVDSASCAACGYLKQSATRLYDTFDDKIEVIEYKITEIENVARVKKLGVKNLPSIYVNGELYVSSMIPNHQEFIAYIKTLV